jgi:hypothetical protein
VSCSVAGVARDSERQSTGDDDDDQNLDDLLRETRILLPGSEVFLAFLTTLPFTQRFTTLSDELRSTYICTFFSALVALACFVTPAAYHRIARPIRDKQRFKQFASRMLVIGLAPMSLSIVLVTYLVTSVVLDGTAIFAALAIAVVIAALWWLVPLFRVHDRVRRTRKETRHGEV